MPIIVNRASVCVCVFSNKVENKKETGEHIYFADHGESVKKKIVFWNHIRFHIAAICCELAVVAIQWSIPEICSGSDRKRFVGRTPAQWNVIGSGGSKIFRCMHVRSLIFSKMSESVNLSMPHEYPGHKI